MGRGFILSFQDDITPRPFTSSGVRPSSLARHLVNCSGLFQASPTHTGVIIGVRDEVQEIAAIDESVALLRIIWPLKQ
jgi:hypothetical protein